MKKVYRSALASCFLMLATLSAADAAVPVPGPTRHPTLSDLEVQYETQRAEGLYLRAFQMAVQASGYRAEDISEHSIRVRTNQSSDASTYSSTYIVHLKLRGSGQILRFDIAMPNR